VAAFERLDLPANVELDISDYGGHCGYIRGWDMTSFTDEYIAARFNAIAAA
jgi:predicted alpha/beta-fold hydrolase